MKTLALISLILLAAALRPGEPLIVHEWGTFTSLQDENGQAIGGINTDDEPVPPFVHSLGNTLLIKPTEVPPSFSKGLLARCLPDVTMRLETPVIYFHPLALHIVTPFRVDVNVEFRGGWLTQFYPWADVSAPGVESATKVSHLRSDTIGRLSWSNLTVVSNTEGPATTEHVWTSPRAVGAASVTTANNESEKFLFYRGVAHIDAPLQVVRDPAHDQLLLRARLDSALADKQLAINYLWLAEIRPDGSFAFRKLNPMMMENDTGVALPIIRATFGDAEFSRQNTALFRADMHHALVKEGLFDDEADALLNTWEISYFKSPGLRLFFIVPRAWTDHYLPLRVSGQSEMQRVMVGRIELVAPAQRELLRKIAMGPAPDMQAFTKALQEAQLKLGSNQDAYSAVSAGRAPIATLGIPIPEAYRAYLDLGRFRNAIVLDEVKRRPTTALLHFIQDCDLKAYEIPSR